MKNKIENKISDVLEAIIAKQPADITYNEYRILDAKLKEFKYEEEQKAKNADMASFMARNLFNCSCPPPDLPDSSAE